MLLVLEWRKCPPAGTRSRPTRRDRIGIGVCEKVFGNDSTVEHGELHEWKSTGGLVGVRD